MRYNASVPPWAAPYEVQPREYEDRLTACGLRITGQTPHLTYLEICEIPAHPCMLGCQFHPEFKSKRMEPHPLFKALSARRNKYRRQRIAPLAQQEEPVGARGD